MIFSKFLFFKKIKDAYNEMSECKEKSKRELSNSTSNSLTGIPERQKGNLQVKSLINLNSIL
jgi:hypothetical protein